MESVSGVRPVQTTSQAPVRVTAPQERQVARTELPEVKAVTAAPGAVDVRRKDESQTSVSVEDKPNAAEQLERTKRVERDTATKELVFRTVNAATGQVVSQYPDEAVLRERAYRINQQREEQLLQLRDKSERGEVPTVVERQA